MGSNADGVRVMGSYLGSNADVVCVMGSYLGSNLDDSVRELG
jgi:hypothetical protein